MQLFLYTSDKWSLKSNKPIVVVCEGCGTPRVTVIRRHKEGDLCRSCVQVGRPDLAGRTGENSLHWKGGKLPKICKICGKEFLVSPYKEDSAKFCSRGCYGKWRSENLRGENNSAWKGGGVTKICEVCGKEFSVNSYQADLARFCSNKCRGEWRSESLCGENNPCWKEKVVKICEVCGKEFSVSPSLSNSRRCCSRGCYGKWRSENMSGENSPLFHKQKPLDTRKRLSATLQGIHYDEWESFAKDQPYCPKFNGVCRESNRVKYDRCCFLSGMTEEENGRRLSVHHVDMNKGQGCDGYEWKLVPLSISWHVRAHSSLWTSRIQYLLKHVWANMEVV